MQASGVFANHAPWVLCCAGSDFDPSAGALWSKPRGICLQQRALSPMPKATALWAGPSVRARLADLEVRSLIAEQARQQAHRLRSPLSVIDLITETLQMALVDDPAISERLGRILGATSTLSTSLTEAVRSTRFGDGPPRPVDVVARAARIVEAFGGCVVGKSGEAGLGPCRGPAVLVDTNSFEAALVHVLRLFGRRGGRQGVAGANAGAAGPTFKWQQDAAGLSLHFLVEGVEPLPTPLSDRADWQLMGQAAERMARDVGGTLTITTDGACFEPAFDVADTTSK